MEVNLLLLGVHMIIYTTLDQYKLHLIPNEIS